MSDIDPNEQTKSEMLRQRILIGSQRDPAAYRARRQRDWVPLQESDAPPEVETAAEPVLPPHGTAASEATVQASAEPSVPEPDAAEKTEAARPATDRPEPATTPVERLTLDKAAAAEIAAEIAAEFAEDIDASVEAASGPPAVPNARDRLSPELEREFDRAMSDTAMDDLLAGSDAMTRQAELEPQSQHTVRVVAVRRGDVFVELGGREQGIIPLEKFDAPPQPGTKLDVVVQRLNAEDGLYELTLPNAAMEVEDWSDLAEGMLVDAHVTGHNTGGLECEVNHLRGFIPVSQIAIYRVEDLAQFVGEKFTCLVTEANPERRNLVLSRRAVLEREREEARRQLFDSLRPGQVHEGVVRKILDFGAFVDIGGVDGLLHVSQVAWGRVQHPREVLSEGQKIKVKIERINAESGKISFGYRDMLENPWTQAAEKYPVNSVVRGTVTNLMDFGAFVELEPGIEGLIHISELSHKRIWRASDVVHKGDQIEVLVLSVNTESQRISLSMKACSPEPEPVKKEGDAEENALPEKPAKYTGPEIPLRGGLGRTAASKRFGMKW